MKTKSRITHNLVLASVTLAAFALHPAAQEPANGPARVLAGLDLQRFKDTVKELASHGDRFQGTASYDAAEDWLATQLRGTGYVVEFHDYLRFGQPRRNMYVTKVGTVFPDRMYMVSAHLDGRGDGGAADDDASGCSLVLEAARAFAQPDIEVETSVRFLWWNNEEQGPAFGSQQYVDDRQALQGIEDPPGSGIYPEPTWLGIIQHDMILFDHGLPPGPIQIPDADLDIEYRLNSAFAEESLMLANTLVAGNLEYSFRYPAEIGSDMCCTDSFSFRNFTAAVSVRENQRLAEIGEGSNPHWHQPTDLMSSYDDLDFNLGFDALRMTAGTVAELAGASVVTTD